MLPRIGLACQDMMQRENIDLKSSSILRMMMIVAHSVISWELPMMYCGLPQMMEYGSGPDLSGGLHVTRPILHLYISLPQRELLKMIECILPRYPIYIPSKGRADCCYTAQCLT